MPGVNGTATETQETRPQLLASSPPQYFAGILTNNFQVRTSQFLKKVSQLRTIRRKSDTRQPPPTYDRPARSMDLGPKVLSKVDIRAHHHSFDQERDSGESSPCHVSLPSPPSSMPHAVHPPLSTSESAIRPPDHSSRTTESLSIGAMGRSIPPAEPVSAGARSSMPQIGHQPPQTTTEARPVGRSPGTVDSSTSNLSAALSMSERAQTLPSRSLTITEVPRNDNQQSSTVDARTRRALAPRLATLPPPMMAGYNAEGRARLTPSLVTRQPPMPILNLPTLPPPTPSQPAGSGRRSAPLRSIPALPMQGPSDAEQDADHENASLEDDEEEEDGEDHAESASGEGLDADSGESGDEEEQDYFETSPRQASATEGPSRLGPLPQVDTSRFSVSFADAESSRTQRTPHAQAGSSVDYFTSKSPEPLFSPTRTPRPADFHPNGKGHMQDVPQPRIVPMPSTPPSPRPGLYHHGSKSMVDLLSMSRKEKDKVISPKLGRALSPPKKPRAPVAEGQPPPADEEQSAAEPESPDDVITSPMLRRRRSLPVYEPSSEPPPYPDPLFQRRSQQPPIQPRDEEGKEELPPYSNSIYLTGVMPRKMEFSQPGVQAKDRKWRRVYCVLEGTMFRVYKAPPAGSAVSAIEQWWESKVGVGDITSVDVTAMTTNGIRVSAVRERARDDQASERPQKIIEEPGSQQPPSSADGSTTAEAGSSSASSPQPPPTRSRLHIGSRLLHRQRSKSTGRLGSNSNGSSSRLSMDSRQDAARPSASHSSANGRRSMDTLGSSRMSNVSSVGTHATTSTALTVPSPTSSTTSPTSSSEGTSLFSRSRLLSHTHSGGGHDGKEKDKDKETPYEPDPKDLIRKYTLQHAESGLASDYTKRKNVIRVRMEGEQFLLQAKDVASVIDWIEGIQMGTNVALDLDERPMPRGPIFPRRRRRRVRRVEPTTSTTAAP
ncbi:hypothetical protein BV20DRAFT_966457 [Pilatotrama ljubarskyi]|nr:hypothetical protein BV20DRAFT_966457 [Pilatotrama ljubarskyi]